MRKAQPVNSIQLLSGLGKISVVAFVTGILLHTTALYAVPPACQSQTSDTDGDGWGWENNISCQVVDRAEPGSGDSTSTNTFPATTTTPKCIAPDSDPDADGWGWENNRSCRVADNQNVIVPLAKTNTTTPTELDSCSNSNSDADGDGYGWEDGRSCIATSAKSAKSAKKTTAQNYQPSDITDLILVTGQSNTLGAGTSVDYQLDGPHPRVFAYTANGWQVAELYQSWDHGSAPGNGDRNASSDRISNNFALHFGKRLAELNANAVIGFVLVSEPGKGIENWDPGKNGMKRIQSKVPAAINELPHKSSIDGILWHQGETDWLYEGTANKDVPQPAPKDYYPVKLAQLINNLRLENWYGKESPFICGETIVAVNGVNVHLNALNSDNDPQTQCVAGAGLPAREVTGRTHFNARGLRIIGQRYAEAYFAMSRR